MLELVFHPRLEGLRDAPVLVAGLLALEDVAQARGQTGEEGEVHLVERLGAVWAEHEAGAPRAHRLAAVDQDRLARLAELAQALAHLIAGHERHDGHAVDRVTLAQLVDVAVELLAPREGKRRRELSRLDLHVDEGRVQLACRLAHHLEDCLKRLVGVPQAKGLFAQLREDLVEARRALRAHGREGADELDRQVVGDGVEQARVLLVDRVLALPAHLDDRDDLTVEPHRHGDEAGKGRQEL